MSPTAEILADLRVVDLTTNVAGPIAARLFGELGADVVHVEPPHGDDGRNSTTEFLGQEGTFHSVGNRNKRGHCRRSQDRARSRSNAANAPASRPLCREHDERYFGRPGVGLEFASGSQPAADPDLDHRLGSEWPTRARARDMMSWFRPSRASCARTPTVSLVRAGFAETRRRRYSVRSPLWQRCTSANEPDVGRWSRRRFFRVRCTSRLRVW